MIYTPAVTAIIIKEAKLDPKKLCQYAPTAAPIANKANLNTPTCHQVKVYDLNNFIFLFNFIFIKSTF